MLKISLELTEPSAIQFPGNSIVLSLLLILKHQIIKTFLTDHNIKLKILLHYHCYTGKCILHIDNATAYVVSLKSDKIMVMCFLVKLFCLNYTNSVCKP